MRVCGSQPLPSPAVQTSFLRFKPSRNSLSINSFLVNEPRFCSSSSSKVIGIQTETLVLYKVLLFIILLLIFLPFFFLVIPSVSLTTNCYNSFMHYLQFQALFPVNLLTFSVNSPYTVVYSVVIFEYSMG